MTRLFSLPLLGVSILSLYPAEAQEPSTVKIPGVHRPVPTDVTTLDLSGMPVTDDALKEVAGLKYLKSLDLRDTKVTTAGLKELAGLQNLTDLVLNRTWVWDDGLKDLAGLKNLTYLGLRGTRVTDSGLRGYPESDLLGIPGFWEDAGPSTPEPP